jgi:MFS family permease
VDMIAVAALLFVLACLLTIGADRRSHVGYAELVMAVIMVGLGECFFTTALMPLVADLAPPALRGRYMASMSLCWWIGLAIAPTLGLQLLGRSAVATFIVAAALASTAGVSALTLNRKLPGPARVTPRPQRASASRSRVET